MDARQNQTRSFQEALPAGEEMYGWLKALFPICRSLTGNGVRTTLRYLQDIVPNLQIHEVPSGTRAFDWTVPDEWNVTEAYVENDRGERVIDFSNHNLHLVGYSEAVDLWLNRDELDVFLHSLPEHPDWIPYATSYYRRSWGFCLSQKERDALPTGRYHAVIRSTLAAGSLTYGEVLIPGDTADEVLLSTYICHPSMANNELSGPVVTAALARWIASRRRRKLGYRIVFVPETLGSIVYISKHLDVLKRKVRAGFVLTCVGDDRDFSFLPSRRGDTLADRVARHVLRHRAPGHAVYSFLDRGSDERQYCAPGIDLPVASIMRSKYGTYPEYHTSADDLTLVSPSGLNRSFEVYRECLSVLDGNDFFRTAVLCEPQLGKRGLYPTLSTRGSAASIRDMMNVIAYCDGQSDLIALADAVGLPAMRILEILEPLLAHGLIESSGSPVPC
jgi:aminopeptidase-like protein